MQVTPTVALTMWCADARLAFYRNGIATVNRDPVLSTSIEKENLCRANACMAWRWLDKTKTTGFCGRAGDQSKDPA